MLRKFLHIALIAASLGLFASRLNAQVSLIAMGSLTSSPAGSYTDLSGLEGTLENGAPANLLGGLGSGLAWGFGSTFLALPDRGPNAIPFDSLIDDTASYIPRFHTIKMDLDHNRGAGLPFTLKARLKDTTLLYSSDRLVYGSGTALAVVPALWSRTHTPGIISPAALTTLILTATRAIRMTPVSTQKAFVCRMMGKAFSSLTSTALTFMSSTGTAGGAFARSSFQTACS